MELINVQKHVKNWQHCNRVVVDRVGSRALLKTGVTRLIFQDAGIIDCQQIARNSEVKGPLTD